MATKELLLLTLMMVMISTLILKVVKIEMKMMIT